MKINEMLTPAIASADVEVKDSQLIEKPRIIKKVTASVNTVSITKDEIVISAGDEETSRQGLNYIRQLEILLNGKLPVCKFEYYSPAWSYRGFMIDVSRHFFSVKELEKVIDAMSLVGYNYFHWHLTDDQGWRFGIDGYEKLRTVASVRNPQEEKGDRPNCSGFYSDEELKEIVSFCEERGITIVPEVDVPGHTTALIAAYPELGCTGKQLEVLSSFGVKPNVLNLCSQEVWTFLTAMFKKLISIFPGPYIHFGGDECLGQQWLENEQCVAKMKELGIDNAFDFQGWFTSRVSRLVQSLGKRAIGWDEVVDAKDIDKDVIVMSWRGLENAEKALSRGHQVILTPKTHGMYLDDRQDNTDDEPGNDRFSSLSKGYDLDFKLPSAPENLRQLILGGQCNIWSERITSGRLLEYMTFPRAFAIAENLWLDDKKNLTGFIARKEAVQLLLSRMDINCAPVFC